MKNLKKVLALLLVAAMAMSLLCVSAFAADAYTLTINNTTVGHTYSIYQIYTGDVATVDGKKVLSNVVYGANYGKTGDPVPETELNAITDADAFAASVAVTGDPVKVVESTATSTGVDGLAAGYYLVKETSEKVPEGETYSKYMLQVVGDASVNVKSGKTTSEKKVKDDDNTENAWQDSADYDIGDKVPFQLKATVASDYANYTDVYKLNFHDQESTGLTFNADSVKVYVDGTEITTGYQVVTPATDGHTFDVVFADLKQIAAVKAGSVITVEYTSTLNENAEIGSKGNPNKMYLEYSNNPNSDQTGKTKEDKVTVFTFKLVVDKYANEVKEGNKLTGAEFTLTKGTETIAVVKSDDGCTFTFKGLDAGEYVLTETKTPAGYNTIDPITITVTAKHDVTADDPQLTELTVTPADNFTVELTEAKTPTGTIKGDVINKSGSTLPTTGGMGTTLFYVFGAILVLGAGVLLIARKRMSSRG